MLKFFCGNCGSYPLPQVKSVAVKLQDVLKRWREIEKWELEAKEGEERVVHYSFTEKSGLNMKELKRRAQVFSIA